MRYLYLHGFTASAQSYKGQLFYDRLAELGVRLERLDFNEGGFESLTLTRQVNQVERAIALGGPGPVHLIGSSFGGLTAAWVAQRSDRIASVVLLAPAFGFPRSWGNLLGPTTIARWQTEGTISVYHYGRQRQLPLAYSFWEDSTADCWDTRLLTRSLPTVIIHGQQDETISINVSRDYARDRPWVQLEEVMGDHALTGLDDQLWLITREFWAKHFS